MADTTTKEWYQLSVNNTFAELNTSEGGLTTVEAKNRLAQYGFNEITVKKPSTLMRFLRQFHNPLVYILLAAAALTGILSMRGEDMVADMSVILGVVILNVMLGFYQEGKTEAALEALKRMLVSECMIVRDGVEKIIAARELVPGDIVVLNSGDKVPADIRLYWAKELYADEAPLTGESTPVRKSTNSIIKPNLPPADQACIAFSGTFITRGSARGIVIAGGESTEFGKIAKLVKETKNVATPLQKKIADFTKVLMISILVLGALNMVLGYFVGFKLVYSFLASVSLVVAAIPEMLPMLVTAILALAAAAMVKRHALIRRLPAAETLGCTTVICSDKTGTLTKNEMTVTRVYAAGKDYSVTGVGYDPTGNFDFAGHAVDLSKENKALTETLRAGYYCNNAKLVQQDDRYNIIGDPTEGALIVSAAKAALTEAFERLDEIPFESGNMYMATLHSRQTDNIIYVKGSPEKILKMCSQYSDNDDTIPCQNNDSEKILAISFDLARVALRLIGMAYKVVPSDKTWLEPGDMAGLTFLGLQGMIDPPREEAIEAIGKCKSAGIRSVMITGDHVMTAKAIAQQLGILKNIEDDALTGEELSRMDDEELFKAVRKISVYARVAPEHKLRITQQLQRLGEIVAMTGDGVNDAPALKSADIGIAMGITGTEVSKEASDMVLTDDNFASIVGAVEEGRHAWNNLE
ncbi:cation-translocating P-type ATPase, partial [Chloroflexota bacterium]